MMECAVTFNLEAAHLDPMDGRLHGHSYLVDVWFKPGPDIRAAKAAISVIVGMVDEKPLEDSVGGPLMEDIAMWLMPRLSVLAGVEVTRLRVHRPTLGFACEAWRA